MTVRVLASAAVAYALTGWLGACGGAVRDAAIVRVGGTAITSAALAHWMSAMAPQHLVPDPPHYDACVARRRVLTPQAARPELEHECSQQYQALRQQALGFLISSRWLIAESAEERMSVSREELEQRLAEKVRSFANGEAEFKESLKAIAHTIADVEFELESEIASEKIRRKLTSGEAKVTSAEIAAFYRTSIASFHVPERRAFYIAENYPSDAAARRAMAAARARGTLAGASLSEALPRKPFTDFSGEKRIIYEAIFKARPHELAGPIRLNNLYFIVEVTRIAPPYLTPLARVDRAIGEKLSAERRRQTLAAFVAAWRKKWTARTDCAAGYAIQKCRQYSGPMAAEEPLQLN